MTIKLYDKDAYQTIFEAQVITCTKRENDYDIVLDQTLFFPEEGGQTCDHGTLNDVEVIDVQIINQEIHHYTNAPLQEVLKERLISIIVIIICKIIVVNMFYQDL